MTKTEQIRKMIELNNGYLFTCEIESAGISRTYLAKFVKDNNMEKVAKGIYVSEDTYPDELFVLQKCYPKIIFSGDTALYLHQMIDREYNEICVSVPARFSGTRLREKGIVIHQEKDASYKLGITTVISNFGNMITTYDRERCVCDLVKNRGKIEVQNFQAAMKAYMKGKNKDLSKLMMYADTLKVRDAVMRYVEVLI